MRVSDREAMALAIEAALTPVQRPHPNPRVGAVIVSADGDVVGVGHHRAAGLAHAEVEALNQAGELARGATAVVTLEPCSHTGRTGPCTEALAEAGVSRVVFAQSDPNGVAAGGGKVLKGWGIDVSGGLMAAQAQALNPAWTFAAQNVRPFVTWKVAATLDGRVAASDGTSRWITGPEARADVHELRAQCDAVLVGTGTVFADDPSLTVRDAEGRLSQYQPMRVAMGTREIAETAAIRDGSAPFRQLTTTDPVEALAALFELDIHHVLLEGGPRLSAAFLRAGMIDAIRWYVAPAFLGGGVPAVGDLGINSIEEISRFDVVQTTQVGADIRIDLVSPTK
jgi:diaminohydroxyphosphoribosylaminopyrimidine deaminase/5-amino-6-(5-phosphoribosylamino)uracil reductase